jgi:hypothetical protein
VAQRAANIVLQLPPHRLQSVALGVGPGHSLQIGYRSGEGAGSGGAAGTHSLRPTVHFLSDHL